MREIQANPHDIVQAYGPFQRLAESYSLKRTIYNFQYDVFSLKTNEDEAVFINDLAVVNAILTWHVERTPQYEEVQGVINKDFRGAFWYESYDPKNNEVAKYLMFSLHNKGILRFGANDFIVKWDRDIINSINYKHVRLVKGKPKLIKEFEYNIKDCKKTKNENIAIAGGQLYNIKKGTYISKKYTQIDEIENQSNLYMVTDKIDTKGLTKEIDENIPAIVDYFYFYINEKGKIVSPIYSMLDQEEIFPFKQRITAESYERLCSIRKQELLKQEIERKEMIYSLKYPQK